MEPGLFSRSGLLTASEWQQLAQITGRSPREIQVVQGIMDSKPECSIADQLGISRHTVNTSLRRLKAKLAARSREEVLVTVFTVYLARVRSLALREDARSAV